MSSSLRMELKVVRGNRNRIYFVLKAWHHITQIHSKLSLKYQKKSEWRKLKIQSPRPFTADKFDAVGHVCKDFSHVSSPFNPLHGFLSAEKEIIYESKHHDQWNSMTYSQVSSGAKQTFVVSLCLTVLPRLCKMFFNERKMNFLETLAFLVIVSLVAVIKHNYVFNVLRWVVNKLMFLLLPKVMRNAGIWSVWGKVFKSSRIQGKIYVNSSGLRTLLQIQFKELLL